MPIEYTEEFSNALAKLHSGQSMFLTGKAGTGKSTLIGEFMRRTDRNVALTATTGIAALNIKGQTVHRFLGLRPETKVDSILNGEHNLSSAHAAAIERLDTLIIDEASMIRADLFDKIAAILQRYGPDPGSKFGGVQLVLVGDLYQLPPVVTPSEEEYIRSHYDSKFFFSAHEYDRDAIPPVQLTRVFRQAGDPELTELLNAVRDGYAHDEVRRAINRRVIPGFEPPIDEFWLTVTTRKHIAAARNRSQLDRLPGSAARSTATITGDVAKNEYPNDEIVYYKPGAQVMMVANDPSLRWVNGDLGTILSVDSDGKATIHLRGRDRTVSAERQTWETTKPVFRDGQIRHEVTGTFTQVPFRLAWAITIHKSQGQTLDHVVVDLTGGSFDSGQTYVALSRATSLQGIVLTQPLRSRDLNVDSRVVRFLSPRTGSAKQAKRCAIAVSTIGADHFGDKARPVEIGIAFEDGTGLSTIVNPDRDPGDALTRYGLSNDQLLLAPTLAEAWTVIAPFVVGHTPVGHDIDRLREVLEHEFKRLGHSVPLPLGTEIARPITATPHKSALERAFDDLYRAGTVPIDDAAEVFGDVDTATGGFILSRDAGQHPVPELGSATATALVSHSLTVSRIALGPPAPASESTTDSALSGVVANAIANRLRHTIERAGRLSKDLTERAARIEELLGAQLLTDVNTAEADIYEALDDGVSVCFTGAAALPGGETVSKKDLTTIAIDCGLKVVDTVTKRGCDVLIAAQMGTQSGKAKKAYKYSIPVFPVEEFLEWATVKQSSDEQGFHYPLGMEA